ncbi:MAG: stage V sporulation protein AE, partial [Chloroflexi bacterium]|nr:stage V sporulation protein AE [Chloroflexota bacterium]
EDVATRGAIGLFTGGFRAASLALSAAVFFAWLMSVLFNPRG